MSPSVRVWRALLVPFLLGSIGLLRPVAAAEAPPVAPPTDFIRQLWYKNSLIYNLDVKVFKDSDGDGIGDFKGLTQSLDYLQSLGVDVIWLAPFQPSPWQDDGYDITDFFAIDPRLGTKADFAAFMKAASARHLRVMMDLVVDHTSTLHPWFQQARASKTSTYHTWYSWSHDRPKSWDKGMVFPGVQTATWTLDPVAGEYYFHRFYDFQPSLNTQNPAVLAKIREIMQYWIDQGIAGFRMDAAPFVAEVRGSDPDKPEHQFPILAQMHQYLQWHRSDAILLGEANVEPKEDPNYFGSDGQSLNMMFNFWVNQRTFYALASSEVKPLEEALEQTQKLSPVSQWSIFLRGHDEVDLGRLSPRERKKVFAAFGPSPNMQLYDRGIRRRLAPMLGDPRRIEMAYSLLFSLPGAPSLRYGEEIGMGDDLSLKERNSVRTPMQWSNAAQAGFSTGSYLVRPVIADGPYAYSRVNVASERADPHSLLSRIERFAQVRKACPEVGWGTWSDVKTGSPHVLALRYQFGGETLLVLHNFGETEVVIPAQELELEGTKFLLGSTAESPATPAGVRMGPYGYAWFQRQPDSHPE